MKGWKTWTATIGYGLCQMAKQQFPEYADMIETFQQTILIPLFGIGIAHKIEKKS